jgi:predicted HicB family RNase H-like nuclease
MSSRVFDALRCPHDLSAAFRGDVSRNPPGLHACRPTRSAQQLISADDIIRASGADISEGSGSRRGRGNAAIPARSRGGQGERTMTYKGYQGRVTLDEEDAIFHGEVINTRDVITFQGTSVSELKSAFQDSVEDYLAFCASRGEEAEKPFSGKFPVRLSPDLHKRTYVAARRRGQSLNAFVAQVLDRATRRDKQVP